MIQQAMILDKIRMTIVVFHLLSSRNAMYIFPNSNPLKAGVLT